MTSSVITLNDCRVMFGRLKVVSRVHGSHTVHIVVNFYRLACLCGSFRLLTIVIADLIVPAERPIFSSGQRHGNARDVVFLEEQVVFVVVLELVVGVVLIREIILVALFFNVIVAVVQLIFDSIVLVLQYVVNGRRELHVIVLR